MFCYGIYKGKRKCQAKWKKYAFTQIQKADANAVETPDRRVSLRFLVLDSVKGLASAKQQRNAPNAGKSYHGVDNAREQGGLSAADPCNKVKLKQTDAAPIERAYDG